MQRFSPDNFLGLLKFSGPDFHFRHSNFKATCKPLIYIDFFLGFKAVAETFSNHQVMPMEWA